MSVQRIFTALMLLTCSSLCWGANVIVTATSLLDFSPQTVTINVGDTVTFVNGGGYHNVVANDLSWGNGAPSTSAWTYTRTFNNVGTFGYYCVVHGGPGGGMFGTVNVQAASTAPSIALGGYMSGNWYNSAQSGHGFELEFTSQPSDTVGQNTVVAYWYAYTPDGTSQIWLYAQGSYDATTNTVTLPALLLGGAKFPYPLSNFDSNSLQQTPWGTITFTFSDCNNGTASWVSTVNGYGNGSMPIARLTSVAGTSCPAQ